MHLVFHSQNVGEVDVFYREAGPSDGLVILLLHGFPTASHMFRDLIPELAGRYRVVLETHAAEIGALMRGFLDRHGC